MYTRLFRYKTTLTVPKATLKGIGAMGLDSSTVVDLFTRGSQASLMLEHFVASELGYEHVGKTGAPYDMLGPEGRLEMRLAHAGRPVAFSQSSMRGAGRKFVKKGFLERTRELAGFLVVSTARFPEITIFEISAAEVIDLYKRNALGSSGNLSNTLFLQLREELSGGRPVR